MSFKTPIPHAWFWSPLGAIPQVDWSPSTYMASSVTFSDLKDHGPSYVPSSSYSHIFQWPPNLATTGACSIDLTERQNMSLFRH